MAQLPAAPTCRVDEGLAHNKLFWIATRINAEVKKKKPRPRRWLKRLRASLGYKHEDESLSPSTHTRLGMVVHS